MFDHLYTLAEGQCVYQGSIQQLVPFLSSLGLKCPSYHNPASFCKLSSLLFYVHLSTLNAFFRFLKFCCYCFTVIEVACGEYGSHVQTLVKAIQNGKHDVQENKPFPDQVEKLNNEDYVKSQNGNYSPIA